MGIFMEIALWRKARQFRHSEKITLPDGRAVHVLEADDADVGVLERMPGGALLEFHVENQPYRVVKGKYKRLAKQLSGGLYDRH